MKIKRYLNVFVVILIIMLVVILILNHSKIDNQINNRIPIQSPNGIIEATISDTTATMEKGLGGLVSMPQDSGMLFIFPNKGFYGFWMKDMNFPIDIIWMNENGVVIGVSDNVATTTYPQIFFPVSDIKYVLEINAGGAKHFDIATGTKLVL